MAVPIPDGYTLEALCAHRVSALGVGIWQLEALAPRRCIRHLCSPPTCQPGLPPPKLGLACVGQLTLSPLIALLLPVDMAFRMLKTSADEDVQNM